MLFTRMSSSKVSSVVRCLSYINYSTYSTIDSHSEHRAHGLGTNSLQLFRDLTAIFTFNIQVHFSSNMNIFFYFSLVKFTMSD